jgi:hypothetical protein
MGQDYQGMQQGEMKPELKETITSLGLEYRLMTQFTSFVAVEEMVVTDGGQPRRIDVPVEVPEGVNREEVAQGFSASYGASTGRFQKVDKVANLSSFYLPTGTGTTNVVTKSGTNAKARSRGAGGGGGVGTGSASGSGAGIAPSPAPAVGAFVLADAAEPEIVRSPEERRREQLLAKLNPSIIAVIDRLKSKGTNAGPDEAKFVLNGKAEIQIWLTDKSQETLAKLKELGFEVVLDPKRAKMLIGRLSIEKLEALAELKFVRYVSPQDLHN